MASKEDIIKGITDHFKGKAYKNCYVGITSDTEERLFGAHQVSRDQGHWIHHTASSHHIARDIEKHFLDKGMDGGSGGGNESSKIVYAYQKTSKTKP